MITVLKYLRRALSQAWRANGREALRALLNAMLTLPHAMLVGWRKRVVCPLCGWCGAHFLPKLGTDWKITSGHTCPKCSSDKRYRTYAVALKRCLPASDKRVRILEVAAPKYSERMFAHLPNRFYVPADLEYRTVKVKTDVTRLAFVERSFDFVLCSHVLEHVQEDGRAMRELHRVLHDNGQALLQVPMDHNLAQTLEYDAPNPAESCHVRRYGRDYRERLQAAGWIVNLVKPWENEEERRRCGGNDEELYFCSKIPGNGRHSHQHSHALSHTAV
ncbi:MAG: methyltransferase domain-containing protein [candidate division KSB1 bacterium]|nr:methyltransferase domain-containing protein [candidate division KSB1 bacterium]MDZ7276098.1 methyltransferase domain-containing protein [candidate division KSB1 bacterium]MDZ7287122.1 methyltransferase domain-containing protein [candidate division KSB1 bacterium]MDZ7296953.1 methyltransferase domain-containing protein [candidate division KSB1 bacterium]MDZ7307156.1 methyltransferase domain-containing protein [candidate division KSB1 bacterium]